MAGAILSIGLASVGCTRARERPASEPAAKVGEDLKDVGRATEKAAKDIGQAAGVGTEDAWITAKVKSELTRAGLDPLHLHVDTAGKVVTLSGTVASRAAEEQAVSLARAVNGVSGVNDHLFVGPPQR